MTIRIPPELDAEIQAKAQARGISVNAYVESLIREDEEWIEQFEESLDNRDSEFAEIRAAVTAGLEQADRGEGRPAEEVFASTRFTPG